jgi:hypothetical protein
MGFLPALPRALAGTWRKWNIEKHDLVAWPSTAGQSPPHQPASIGRMLLCAHATVYVMACSRCDIDISAKIVACAPYGGWWGCSWLAVPR